MKNYELHPLCTLFPRLDEAAFDALVDDLTENGLREPITLHDGMILDGGNRYRACFTAGIEPRFVEFAGSSPVAYVLSANLHRRHLTPGQHAAIVASCQDWAKANTRGGDRKSDQAATLPFDSVNDRAAQSGASERTQRMADKVVRESPELGRAVARGEISLPKALKQIAPPKPKHASEDEEEDVYIPTPEECDPEPTYAERMDELAELAEQQSKELETWARIHAEDDHIAALTAEVHSLLGKLKQRDEMERVLQSRLDGLMNENCVLKREVKRLQRQMDHQKRQA